MNCSDHVLELPNNINDWAIATDKVCWKISKINQGDIVKVNLGKVDFIKPSGLILLSVLCRHLYNITRKKIIIEGMQYEVYKYLNKVSFFNVCQDYLEETEFYKISVFSDIKNIMSVNPYNTIKIMRVKPKDFIEFTQLNTYIGPILNSWLPESWSNEYKSDIQTALAELCNNSIEHSESETFFTLQKYKNEWVELSIGDAGIGISGHLRLKYNWLERRDVDFIKVALQGKTGRKSGRGGFGLQTVQELVKQYNGEMNIHSLKGSVKITGSKNQSEINHNYSFPGTRCHVILRKPNMFTKNM